MSKQSPIEEDSILTIIEKVEKYELGCPILTEERRKDFIDRLEAYTTNKIRDGKYAVLQDLLDWEKQWHDTHLSTNPFNWYGAIKAMLVMKEPQKPFVTLNYRKDKDETN